jgi:hypothetical protein
MTQVARAKRGLGAIGTAAAVAVLCAVPGQAAMAAAEVQLGGYHDQILEAAHRDIVGRSVSGSVDHVNVGGIRISVASGEASALTGFTPRFAAPSLGFTSRIDSHTTGTMAGGGDPARRALRIGPQEGTEIAGFEFGWSAIAELEELRATPEDTSSAFMVGGELAVRGLRLDAAVGQDPGLLRLDGQQMRAGLGYDFGGFDTHISYSLVERESEEPAGLVTVGSSLTLRPWLVLKGDVAVADDPSSGETMGAGRVGFRLSF